MDKPILLWDRSQCSEQVCTCHDDSSPPRFCTGCGCNVASPGHRNTLDAFDRQAARIAELEGALRTILERSNGYIYNTDQDTGNTFDTDARRVLGEGGAE